MSFTQVKVTTMFALIGLLTFFFVPAEAVIGPLVLQMYPDSDVVVEQIARYSCKSNAHSQTTGDPSFEWAIKDSANGNVIYSIPETNYDQFGDPSDGEASSTVEFIMKQNFLTQTIHCMAKEPGSQVVTSSIYGDIKQASGGLGQKCNSNGGCNAVSLTCNSLQICVCAAGYYQSGNICEQIATGDLGEPCTSAGGCNRVSLTCNSQSTCVCASNYYESGNTCIPKVEIGGFCTSDFMCRPFYAYCNASMCTCNPGYVLSNRECILDTTANLGESCAQGQSCVTQFAQCSTTFPRICVCQDNYYRDNTICRLKGGITESCNSGITDSCLPAYECVNNICQCPSGYTQSGSTCVPAAKLGESCAQGQTCVSPFSQCSTTFPLICVCQLNFYEDNRGLEPECLAKGAIGEDCNSAVTDSCLPGNSVCTNNKCQCRPGYIQFGTGCLLESTAGIGESCDGVSVLCPPNARCIGSPALCQCSTGYVRAGSTCTKPALGQSCDTSVGCLATANGGTTANPECSGGVCSCPSSNYYILGGQCILKSALGIACNSNVFNSCIDPNAQCSTSTSTSISTCQCKQGYIIVVTGGVSACTIDTSSEICPASSGNTTPKPGISSPETATTPSILVGSSCYAVDRLDSVLMECEDANSGGSAIQYGGWQKFIDGAWTDVPQDTGHFINGDAAIPSVTVSVAVASDAGTYRCELCYGTGRTRCAFSEDVTLFVRGSEINTVVGTMSPNPAIKDSPVTLTCIANPADIDTSYRWLKDGVEVSSQATYTIDNVQPNSDGRYVCQASNQFGTKDSDNNPIIMSVSYAPEFSIPGGGNTRNVYGNLTTSSISIVCEVTAKPVVDNYYFYDNSGQLLQVSKNDTYIITATRGYGRYYCRAENAIGLSLDQFFFVQPSVLSEIGESCATNSDCRPQNSFCNSNSLCQCNSGYVLTGQACILSGPNIGAATEDNGISTGTIAAIVLGIIFLILLIIIIIVCCCSYGWCRKKEKVQPQVIVEQPHKQYIPRTLVSATSTVSRKDVGILVKGNDFPESQEKWPYANGHYGERFIAPVVAAQIPETGYYSQKPPVRVGDPEETRGTPYYYLPPPTHTEESPSESPFEPEERYTPTPRYHLKRDGGGPIISMYDDTYNQPKALQLPDLETQYLYTDEEPKKRRRRRKKHREDRSPRRNYYEADPDQEEVDTKYAEVLDSRSDDLVVVPGKQNYYE